jgi:hypothetical protein
LSEERHDATHREYQADFDLGPLLGGQIDRDERTESGLDVGEKEDEPIKPAAALA